MTITRDIVRDAVDQLLVAAIDASTAHESVAIPFREDLAGIGAVLLSDFTIRLTDASGPAFRLDELRWGPRDAPSWQWKLTGQIERPTGDPLEVTFVGEGSLRLMEHGSYVTSPYNPGDPLSLAIASPAEFMQMRQTHAALGIGDPLAETAALASGLSDANERLNSRLTTAMLARFPDALEDLQQDRATMRGPESMRGPGALLGR